MNKFKQIILIGNGKVAKKCKEIAMNFFNKEVLFIENSTKNFLDDFFNKIKNSLIISANNFYIFKEECVKNNFIINYHNSLLPYHKGFNANIWSIWENDKTSGITWHKVDENIDTGNIILQKEIILSKEITAIKLLQLQSNLAINSFKECLENLNNNFSQKRGGVLS
ncbi:formyltransferase family protein [Campylobacter peloridis]|uniref:formyltransferase family protein n=1 Tax=Campylobacter peloridis TaxID=488546 RepID=UPI0036F2303D